jgi:hypothetical protein
MKMWEAEIPVLEQFFPSTLCNTMSPDHRTGRSRGKTLDPYSGGTRFESRDGKRLSRPRFFVVFPNPSRQMPG